MKATFWTSLAIPAAALGLLAAGCGEGGREPAGRGDTLAAADTPAALQKASYVGSGACKVCHAKEHEGWLMTAHTQKLRDGRVATNYANGAAASGMADYFRGAEYNLGAHANPVAPATPFATYGANAPVLGKDAGGAYAKIGANKYYIAYTLGGSASQPQLADQNGDGLILGKEAQWKQRYVVKIGKSHYVLPFQYNQASETYTTYSAGDWYDGATAKTPAKNKSYENTCAGCHTTGLTVAQEGDEWVMSFTDIAVGCEACHGAGSRHAASPAKDNIVHPAKLKASKDLNGDGKLDPVDDLVAQNYVCYQCHTRGKGKAVGTGTAPLFDFPAVDRGDGTYQTYVLGEDWRDYFTTTTAAGDYWGWDAATTTFVASKSHRQEQLDHAAGPHGADKSYDKPCFSCHDLHSTERPHLVAKSLKRDGIDIPVTASYDTLCLACHIGHGPFAGITASALFQFARGSSVASVGAAIADHTRHASGDTRCVDCHMPKTAKTTGLSGPQDIASHTFSVIEPNASLSTAASKGVPNSCSGCHTKGLSENDDGWANRLQGYFDYLFRSKALAKVGTNDFMGTQACALCHADQAESFLRSGHNFKVTKVEKGQMPSFPYSSIATRLQEVGDATGATDPADTNGTKTDNVPGDPRDNWNQATYADVSYVVGGYGWKSRWIDNYGYLITGSRAQFNLQNSSWSAYNNNLVVKYDYNCNYCHTTGARVGSTTTKTGTNPTNFSPTLPGFDGDGFAMTGIQCESCHGAGRHHMQTLLAADIVKLATARTRADLLLDNAYGKAVHCGECHTRDGERLVKYDAGGALDPAKSFKSYFELRRPAADQVAVDSSLGGLVVSNAHGRTSHHEQYEELQGIDPNSMALGARGKHKNIHCSVCHDPHKTLKYQDKTGEPAMRGHCTNCHSPTTDGKNWAAFAPAAARMVGKVDCIDCHMPRLVQNAITQVRNGWTFGDDHTHVLKIDLKKSAATPGPNGQNVELTDADGTKRWYANPWITREFACRWCHAANHVADWSTFKVHN